MSAALQFDDEPILTPGFMDAEEHDLLRTILSIYNEPFTEGCPTTKDAVLAGETVARCFNFIYSAYLSMVRRLAEIIPTQKSVVEPIFEQCKHAVIPTITQLSQAMTILNDILLGLRAQLINGSSWSALSRPIEQFNQLIQYASSSWRSSRTKLVRRYVPQLRQLVFQPCNPIPLLATPVLGFLGLTHEFPAIEAWVSIKQFASAADSLDACLLKLEVVQQHLTYFANVIGRLKYDPKSMDQASLDRVSTALLRYYGSWSQVASYADSNCQLMAGASTQLQTLSEWLDSRNE